MTSLTLLQTSTGGSPFIVALTLVSLLITAILALIVAYLVIRGYSQNRDRARLYLAVGLLLLTTGPILSQFILTNLDVASHVRSAIANSSKLAGLAAMLYAIYGVTQSIGGSTARRRPDCTNYDSAHTEEDES
ncbi:DUF7521 family protein [Halegenticoccus tardaugens]